MIDQLTECGRCSSDGMYIQEINGNKTGQCFGCGYVFNTLMTADSQLFKEQLEILPEIYKVLASEDEDGVIWLPSFTNVEGKGMVYANGTTRDNWWWEAVKFKKLKVPEVKNHKKIVEKINPKSIKRFNEDQFFEALEYIKVL